MNVLKTILDGIAMPVIAVNTDMALVAGNRRAVQAFPGIGDPEYFSGFLAQTNGLRERLNLALASGGGSNIKCKMQDGSDYSVTVQYIGAVADLEPNLILMTFEDRSQLADLKSMRTGFVANVSHEIRSPLTAISGFVETLQGPAIEDIELRTKFLDMMAREVTRMTNLVSDLLSLSQVEAMERQAPKNEVFPTMMIGQAVETTSSLAKKCGKTLIVNATADLPAVIGSHDDLIRVLINILENAIHYSRENGQVRLMAQVAQADNPLGKKAISISITDDGEGIPAQEIPRLTQRFYRVDKSRSRNLGGTGLGLAIVKHILVRHQGRLVVESQPGQGAVFTIYLPITRS